MAYNNGFPVNYQQFYQPPQIQQQIPQIQQQNVQQMQQNVPQIQNGGFMLVPSEDIARSYPVAPGNCVTFKIEGQPIVMEKSMGFSQLEAPRIDRYRLVREEEIPQAIEPKKEEKLCQCNEDLTKIKDEIKSLEEAYKERIDRFEDEITDLKNQIDDLKGQIPKQTTSKKKDSGGE